MALAEAFETEDLHPIDIVEYIAEHHDWEFDRASDNQISMAIEGQWRTYSITLAWNKVNDKCWAGSFSYWTDEKLMVYRYGLILAGGQTASAEQIDTAINVAVTASERYYPAFSMVTWAGHTVDEAMQVAIAEAYGRA